MSLSRPRRDREEDDDRAGGEDMRESPPAKRPRCCSSCCCCQEKDDFYEIQSEILKKEMARMSKGFTEERKEMREFYQNSQLQLKELIAEQDKRMQECHKNSQLILEQFHSLNSKIKGPGNYAQQNNNLRSSPDNSEIGTYRLKFENRCCDIMYSRRVITADDGNPIKVAIHDREGRIVTHGPLSSMQIKIVVLDGEFNNEHKDKWDGDYFRSKIVYGRPGKPPLFCEELYLRLENGVANLYDAKFQDNSSFVPSKKFKLGVMAVDDSVTEKIQDGMSESFRVKDGRGFRSSIETMPGNLNIQNAKAHLLLTNLAEKKPPCPSLSDPVYKLMKIDKKGDRRKLLELMGIKTVQKFLWFYNKDMNSLRKGCANIPDHDWDIIVGHALSCTQDHTRYSAHIQERDITILCNSIYTIIGANFSGTYTSYENLNKAQMDLVEKYRTTAYNNLEPVQYEGDSSRCYLQGSCAEPPCPTVPTRFFDESSHQNMVLENDTPRAIAHPHQRWVKIVTTVTTLHFWKEASVASWMDRMLENFCK